MTGFLYDSNQWLSSCTEYAEMRDLLGKGIALAKGRLLNIRPAGLYWGDPSLQLPFGRFVQDDMGFFKHLCRRKAALG